MHGGAVIPTEPEITAPVLLCGAGGRLNPSAIGWSRRPLHTCNLPASLERKKKWNYWAVASDDLLFSATIADVDIAQIGGAYIFERKTHRHIGKTVVRPANTVSRSEERRVGEECRYRWARSQYG